MELRDYWRIVRRRWWLPVALVALVGAASLALYRAPAPVYQATLRFIISVASDRNIQGVDTTLTGAQAAEYIRDDFVEIVHSGMFARDVNAVLAGSMPPVGKDNFSSARDKQHRILTLTITWPDPQQASLIGNAAAKTLETQNAKYFKQMGSEGASLTVIDGPDVTRIEPGVRERLDIPIRLALALIGGILLTFLVDYVDDTVRDARELEEMGLRVLGEIPRETKRGGKTRGQGTRGQGDAGRG